MRVPVYLLVMLAVSGTAVSGAAACAGPPAPLQQAPAPRSASPEGRITLSASGQFARGDIGSIAYNRKLAPAGSQASVTIESGAGMTRTSLVVEGLLPNRRYGAHIHTSPCGRKPEDSGPHYQHDQGKINSTSEIWLDFATDGEGAGRAAARHGWTLDPARLPGSLVIHSKRTVTSGPQVGQAGDRVACLTLR